jgi:hypothetical protein
LVIFEKSTPHFSRRWWGEKTKEKINNMCPQYASTFRSNEGGISYYVRIRYVRLNSNNTTSQNLQVDVLMTPLIRTHHTIRKHWTRKICHFTYWLFLKLVVLMFHEDHQRKRPLKKSTVSDHLPFKSRKHGAAYHITAGSRSLRLFQ